MNNLQSQTGTNNEQLIAGSIISDFNVNNSLLQSNCVQNQQYQCNKKFSSKKPKIFSKKQINSASGSSQEIYQQEGL